jgi:glycosyltransferase involved in cell wall biosynthesis
MFKNKKVIVVMPAYNAEKTLLKTYNEVMEQDCVDLVIVVDDASIDRTVKIAKRLKNIKVFQHKKNLGYGANQKRCYLEALKEGADIVIMVHPDYQYTPKLIPAMVALIANETYHCVIASRILGGYALKGGMPLWRYISNRTLTFIENIFIRVKLSEYHTGYRAFSREVLDKLDLKHASNDFVFDNQMLTQVIWLNYKIAEISCPTKYFDDASNINFRKCIKYGIGCIITALQFRLAKFHIYKSKLFSINKK